MTAFFKLSMSLLGLLLMAAGVVITPLPGPFGVPIILLGLIVLLKSSTWVKRLFIRLGQKYPRAVKPLRALLRPGAKVVALMWLHSLRLERRILSPRFRFMYRFRHEMKLLLKQRRHRPAAIGLTVSTNA